MGGLDGFERFRQRADLIDLDQDGVGGAFLDAFAQALRVGDEEIVADELDLVAMGSVDLPAGPIVFRHAVFDRYDRILGGEPGQVLAGLESSVLRLAFQVVVAVLGNSVAAESSARATSLPGL